MELRRFGEASLAMSGGIIYVYEDGGKYCGEWEDDQAHGYGVCTGPQGMGTFEGLWERGNQVIGVFTWPTGQKYTGQWKQGLRDGLGKENKPDGTEYAGDFTRDLRGPFGVMQLPNGTVYSGTWSGGVQEGAGVESYSDGGVYRGQYKKGVRHGHGTRSSSAYESNPPSQDTPNSNDSLSKKISITSIGSTKWTSRPWMGVRPSDSAELKGDGGKLSGSSSQIYEGEWKDDKRHGHGVLKVPGNYTYYGQWEQNMKTGYGVLAYGDGQREEGQWLNGKLVSILKRKKKISLQYRHLEGKVKQAYTLAIQAADMARTKAVLAESRASSANVKCRSAQKTAQQAAKDAQVAKEKAEMHKCAPKLAEGLNSPLPLEFSSTNLWKMSSEATSMDTPNLLQVNHKIPTSSSFEDISGVTKNDLEKAPLSISSSNTSLNESESSSSSAFDLNLTRHNQEDFRKEMEIYQRRSRFQHRSSSSSSKGSLDESVGASFNNSSPSDSSEKFKLKRQQTIDMLVERRRRPAPFHTSSGTDISLSHSHMVWHLPEEVEEEEEGKNDRVPSVVEKVDRESGYNAQNARRVDKTTGERCVGDASDDDSFEERKRAVDLSGQRTQQLVPPPPPRPLVSRSSITFDMLMQMANWNKMVAYINFALLIFLLILILVFVMSIHFHFSSHSNVQQNPASFMNQMA